MEQLTGYTIIHVNEELDEEELKDLVALLSMLNINDYEIEICINGEYENGNRN